MLINADIFIIFTHHVDSAHKELGSLPTLGVPDLPEAQKICQLRT